MQNTTQIENLLTVKEAADQLRVAPLTIYRAVESGRLKAQRVGKLIRITSEALADFTAGKAQ
jgi:excisionase family DNA binding protein